jgi:hypothetical protein
MKRYPLLLLFIIAFASSIGQNLVPNANFEQYTTCPTALGQMQYCTGWNNYAASTPDYYNSCSSSATGIPSNLRGHQTTLNGNGYAGLQAKASIVNYGEALTRSITPLIPNFKYEVSLWISCSGYGQYSTNDFGIFFFDAGPSPSSVNPSNLPKPQVSYTSYGIISDTVNWVKLTKYFVADSTYDNIVIAAFHDNATSTLTKSNPNAGFPSAYYFIDSVLVYTVSKLGIHFYDTMLCSGDIISVPYSVSPYVTFLPGNIFTLQLSNASGSFANPVNIGSITSTVADTIIGTIPSGTTIGTGYRLRLVSSNPADVSEDNGKNIAIGPIMPVKPVANSNSPVCTNDTLRLNASTTTPNVTWKWTGPTGFNSSLQNPILPLPTTAASGNYIVTASIYGCKAKDTVSVSINTAPAPLNAFAFDDTLCTHDTLKLSSVRTSGATYLWAGPNGFTSSSNDTNIINVQTAASGNYIVIASKNGCIERDTITVFVKPAPALNAQNNGPLCTGSILNLTTPGFTIGATYTWSGPGGYSSNLTYPVRSNVNTTMSGNYIIQGVLNGCTDADTTIVLIYPLTPKPTATSNTPACVDGDIILNTSAITGATYYWAGPGLYYATTQNAVRQNAKITDGGKYIVTATINGCASEPDTTIVNVIQGPEVLIYPNPGDTICPGWDVNFVAVPKNAGSNPAYQWFKDGTSVGTGATYKATGVVDGDTFYVKMTAGTACNTPISSKPMRITVLPVHTPPAISITANPGTQVWPYVQVTFNAHTGNAGLHPGYQWRRNGADIPFAKGSILKLTDLKTGDTICCVVTSNHLCAVPREVESNCLVMNVDLGVESGIENENEIFLYPNPNKGNFTIDTKEAATLYISNIQGQLISIHELKKGRNDIQLQNISAGVYICKIESKNGNIKITKFVMSN